MCGIFKLMPNITISINFTKKLYEQLLKKDIYLKTNTGVVL